MSDLAEEALAQDSSYCSSTVDNPKFLSQIGKYMFRWNVTISGVFVVDDELCDRVTFR